MKYLNLSLYKKYKKQISYWQRREGGGGTLSAFSFLSLSLRLVDDKTDDEVISICPFLRLIDFSCLHRTLSEDEEDEEEEEEDLIT